MKISTLFGKGHFAYGDNLKILTLEGYSELSGWTQWNFKGNCIRGKNGDRIREGNKSMEVVKSLKINTHSCQILEENMTAS